MSVYDELFKTDDCSLAQGALELRGYVERVQHRIAFLMESMCHIFDDSSANDGLRRILVDIGDDCSTMYFYAESLRKDLCSRGGKSPECDAADIADAA
jgi:hypothetical protein